MSLLLTPDVARDVARIIRDHHAAIAAVLFGPAAVTKDDTELAIRLGFIDPANPPDPAGMMTGLHLYGAFLAHVKQAEDRPAAHTMTREEFLEHVEAHPLPMTAVEYRAAVFSAARAAEYVVGLGNRVGAQVGTSLIEADHELDQRLRGAIRDAVAARFGDQEAQARLDDLGAEKGLDEEFFRDAYRNTVREVASDIGHATGDWTRDIQRIAHTETHRAVEEGIKEAWLAEEEQKAKPGPILVYKLPRPDCCDRCADLFLDGAAPRIFELGHLQGNGTNIGRKSAAWRAVCGPVHPWCGCTLHKVPSLVRMPRGWKSGEAAPSVIGPGGRLLPGGSP